MFGFGVEQPAIRTADAIGSKCLFQIVRLQEDREAGDRAFLDRRGGERGQRRPEMFLHFRRDLDAFAHEDRHDPGGGPGAFIGVVDAGERLQRNRGLRAFGEPAAEIVPVAAHGERRGADRAAEVKGEDLGTCIAPELERHEGEQHGLACAGRADDEGVAHVPDVKGKPERGRAFGLAVKQRGRTEMLVPALARPHG